LANGAFYAITPDQIIVVGDGPDNGNLRAFARAPGGAPSMADAADDGTFDE
jgi:hypothetical protein